MYVTYEYYLGTYGGRHASAAAFTGLEVRASSLVNFLTFNRVTEETLTDPIKMAICEIVDALEKLDQTGGRVVSHESIGTTQSMTYETSQGNPEVARAKAILTRYIGHTGLMYRGG